MILLGSSEAGKSSIVESLVAGKGVLVKDRTQVINLKQWNITKTDIVHIMDHGGHAIYAITRTLFISKHSIIFIVHDVIKMEQDNIAETVEILRQALHQQPKNEIFIIFTHIDLRDADEVARNRDILMSNLKQFLDDEINNLNKLLIEKKSKEETEDIIQPTEELLLLFKAKRSHLPFFCVSSQSYSGMKAVTEFLVSVTQENRTPVPESWVDFYREIIGTKRMYLTMNEASALFQHTITAYLDDRAKSDDHVADYVQSYAELAITLPQHRSESLELSEAASTEVHPINEDMDDATTDASIQIFQKVTTIPLEQQLAICNIVRKSKDEFLVPLRYFADSNLCLHYESHPFLKNYVFHDIDLLVDLFKSLFHHDISEVIDYESNEVLQAVFLEGECDLAVQQYQKEGLLSQELLSYLWEHYKLSHTDNNILLELMQSFNLCYSIFKDEPMHFFPWFVQSQECPPHIAEHHLKKFDRRYSSVHLQCQFFNQMPLNVFEMISVCLQRKATEEYHYMGDRVAWHDGLEVSIGSVQCVLTRSKENSTIDLCLYGKVDDMAQVWEIMESLYQDVDFVLKPFYGVIRRIHFICRHCDILDKEKPKHWLPKFVFPKKALPRFVKCGTDEVPAALIVHVFKGKKTAYHLQE